jgi:predicted deacylase
MPVFIMHGTRDGPTVWVNGAVHGDELNGVEIVRRLVLSIDPRQLSGTIIAVPMVNVFGIMTQSRYLPDGRDLNRSFPGSPRGSLAARLAHIFFQQVVLRCQLGIDLHTGSGGRANLPHIRCDLDDKQTRKLASAFHPPVCLHASVRDGSLRAAAQKAGIPVLLYEAGEALRFSDQALRVGLGGTLRVLCALGMIRRAPKPPAPATRTARQSKWCRANRSGFCHTEVGLGAHVRPGDHVATIVDAVEKSEHTVRSTVKGIVIGILRTGIVHRGDALIHIAEGAR